MRAFSGEQCFRMPSRVSNDEVEAVEGAVALLELVDHAQRLQVVLEAAVRLHALVQRVLPGVPERRVAEVVRQRDRLDQILVHAELPCDRAADLRDLERVRQARAEEVAFVVDEDLRLVLEPPERARVDHAVAVALEGGPPGRRPAPGVRRPRECSGMRRVRREAGDFRGARRHRNPPASSVSRTRPVGHRALDRPPDRAPARCSAPRRASAFLSPRMLCSASSALSPSMRGGSPASATACCDAAHVAVGDQAESSRQIGRQHHAAADRLAVQPLRVPGQRLDGVAERVPEIQQRALARLALVAADHAGLDLAGAADRARQRRRLARAQRRQVADHIVEVRGIGKQPVLEDLRQPGRQFARGQRLQHIGVRHDDARLVERPDQVLAARMIDAGLAADRRVDLREQRRRHLDDADAAHVDRRGEAREVADHAAAERDHHALAVRAVLDQRIEDARHAVPALGALAVRQPDQRRARDRPAARRARRHRTAARPRRW